MVEIAPSPRHSGLWLVSDNGYEQTNFPIFFSWKYHMQASTMSSFSQASPSQTQTSQHTHTQAVTPTQPVTLHTDGSVIILRWPFSLSLSLFLNHLSYVMIDFLTWCSFCVMFLFKWHLSSVLLFPVFCMFQWVFLHRVFVFCKGTHMQRACEIAMVIFHHFPDFKINWKHNEQTIDHENNCYLQS